MLVFLSDVSPMPDVNPFPLMLVILLEGRKEDKKEGKKEG